jgi:hypothetical protein
MIMKFWGFVKRGYDGEGGTTAIHHGAHREHGEKIPFKKQ